MSKYFSNRAVAGVELSVKLQKYRYENCAVLALNPGAVLVAEQIAAKIHSVLMMLLIEDIEISENDDTIIGTLDNRGSFIYNNTYSSGELEEWTSEYHNSIEAGKLTKLNEMHRLLGEHGVVDDKLLLGRNVILVSDGLRTGVTVAAAINYLKPIKTEKIISAVPVASVTAVDKLHLLTDEIQCLSVVEQYFDTAHYYDDNSIPDTPQIVAKIDQIIKNWQ